jgi:hypothetical protein
MEDYNNYDFFSYFEEQEKKPKQYGVERVRELEKKKEKKKKTEKQIVNKKKTDKIKPTYIYREKCHAHS